MSILGTTVVILTLSDFQFMTYLTWAAWKECGESQTVYRDMYVYRLKSAKEHIYWYQCLVCVTHSHFSSSLISIIYRNVLTNTINLYIVDVCGLEGCFFFFFVFVVDSSSPSSRFFFNSLRYTSPSPRSIIQCRVYVSSRKPF